MQRGQQFTDIYGVDVKEKLRYSKKKINVLFLCINTEGNLNKDPNGCQWFCYVNETVIRKIEMLFDALKKISLVTICGNRSKTYYIEG